MGLSPIYVTQFFNCFLFFLTEGAGNVTLTPWKYHAQTHSNTQLPHNPRTKKRFNLPKTDRYTGGQARKAKAQKEEDKTYGQKRSNTLAQARKSDLDNDTEVRKACTDQDRLGLKYSDTMRPRCNPWGVWQAWEYRTKERKRQPAKPKQTENMNWPKWADIETILPDRTWQEEW